jgi:hypothetical protein
MASSNVLINTDILNQLSLEDLLVYCRTNKAIQTFCKTNSEAQYTIRKKWRDGLRYRVEFYRKPILIEVRFLETMNPLGNSRVVQFFFGSLDEVWINHQKLKTEGITSIGFVRGYIDEGQFVIDDELSLPTSLLKTIFLEYLDLFTGEKYPFNDALLYIYKDGTVFSTNKTQMENVLGIQEDTSYFE